ncbi:MAG: rod shape-determining protein RodA [Gemmatimonadota bacterium]
MRRPGRRGPRIGDRWLLILSLLLAAIGVAMIFSAGQVDVPSEATGIWMRQGLWLGIALIAFYSAARVPLRWLEWSASWLYILGILLLIVVLAIGTGPNTRSWIRLGPMSLQPAEFAKFATILLLARLQAGAEEEPKRLAQLWKPVAVVLLPFSLVLLQPDLGSAIIFGVILISALFWAGVPLAKIFLLVSPGVGLLLGFSPVVWGAWFIGLAVFLYFHRPFLAEGLAVLMSNIAAGSLTLPLWRSLAPYQQNRLLVFLNPGIDPKGAGWHLIQSKVAIGSGGWMGQGFAQGPQKRLAFLPEQHTDFIFSVVGEELGFLGVLALLALFGFFLWRVLRVARLSSDEYGSIVVFCLFAVWFAHLAVNVGMTVGLMPITGLPLPFLSYGGSFLLLLFTGLGVVQRIASER